MEAAGGGDERTRTRGYFLVRKFCNCSSCQLPRGHQLVATSEASVMRRAAPSSKAHGISAGTARPQHCPMLCQAGSKEEDRKSQLGATNHRKLPLIFILTFFIRFLFLHSFFPLFFFFPLAFLLTTHDVSATGRFCISCSQAAKQHPQLRQQGAAATGWPFPGPRVNCNPQSSFLF